MSSRASERTLERAAAELVRAFRLGMEGDGNAALARFVDGLVALFASAPPAADDPLLPLLSEILAAQERGDYLGVADLIQHRLRPLTDERRARLEA
jgi:hypothetical protein